MQFYSLRLPTTTDPTRSDWKSVKLSVGEDDRRNVCQFKHYNSKRCQSFRQYRQWWLEDCVHMRNTAVPRTSTRSDPIPAPIHWPALRGKAICTHLFTIPLECSKTSLQECLLFCNTCSYCNFILPCCEIYTQQWSKPMCQLLACFICMLIHIMYWFVQ